MQSSLGTMASVGYGLFAYNYQAVVIPNELGTLYGRVSVQNNGVVLRRSEEYIISVLAAPVITSNGGGDSAVISRPENQTTVTTVTASDEDSASLDYSIVSGYDRSLFTIDSVTGALRFIDPPDYEAPADFGANNSYEVVVRVSDSQLYIDQSLTITITDVSPEDPVITSDGAGDTADLEVLVGATAVTTVTAEDDDSSSLTYSISGGDDQAFFHINWLTGVLAWRNPAAMGLDNDGDDVYLVEVSVSDGLASDSQLISVTVSDSIIEDFENGLSSAWSTSTTNNGLIEVTTNYTPYQGSRHLVMSAPNGDTINTATWTVNLQGATGATLSFWWKDFVMRMTLKTGLC